MPIVLAVENTVFINPGDVLSLGSLFGTAAGTENMLLAIHSLGYGSVWLGFPPILKATKEVIAAKGEIIGVLPIGHPAEHQESAEIDYFKRPRTRKPVDEVAQYYD